MDVETSWKQIWSKLRKDSRPEVLVALCDLLAVAAAADIEISEVAIPSFPSFPH